MVRLMDKKRQDRSNKKKQFLFKIKHIFIQTDI